MSLNLFSISGLLLSFVSFIVIYVVLKYGKSKVHYIWALFNFVLSIWGISSFFVGNANTSIEALFWLRFGHIGVIFIPILFFHHVILFCEIQREKLLKLAYLQGCIFLFLNLTTDSFLPNNARIIFNSFYYTRSEGLLYPIFLLIWISLMTYSHIELLRFYKHSQGLKRNQIHYFLLGTIIGFLGGVTNFFPHFGIYIYPFGNFTIPLYCILFTYAIFRYRLMDISIIFKRTMAYSLSAGLIMGFFVVLTLTITKLLSTYTNVDSFKVSIFAALFIALLFNPIRNKMQTIIDRLFYKKTYDYYGTLQKVSHDLATMLDIKRIFSFIGDTIFSTLSLNSIYLLAVVPGGGYEVVYHKSFEKGKDKDEHPEKYSESSHTDKEIRKIDKIDFNAVKLLRPSDDIVIKDELPAVVDILGDETVNSIRDTLKSFDGEVMVPVFVDDKLSLLMILGAKLSEDIFTDEDVKLLNTISHQMSISVKNARLYAHKLNSDRLASIGMMSATFAHEIRNPLTSIKTFTQLFPEKFEDAEFRNTFSKIVVDDIGRIDGLIKDLLSFSSKESVPGINTLNVTELVNGVLEHQKGRCEFEKNNISLRKKYKDARINILGDPQKLKRALINIINNGCQAMQENGVLTVDIVSNSKEVDIKISDTGKGMTSQEIAKIFDPFYTTKAMGIGLGLAISKKIIEDHDGRIAVESKLSQGTTFTISLPVEKKSDN